MAHSASASLPLEPASASASASEVELHASDRPEPRADERLLALEGRVDRKLGELESAMVHVKRRERFAPICVHCKSARDEHNTWLRVETLVGPSAEAVFTHALCARCLEKHYPEHVEPGGAVNSN